jgi:small subunit ribosomal protein S2
MRAKLEANFGSIADLTRLPSALFIVDISKEHIAVAEAKRLNIPTFAIVDSNSNPNVVDYPIPANDDASTSIELIIGLITKAIEEGLAERKVDKEAVIEEKEGKSNQDDAQKLAESAKIKSSGDDGGGLKRNANVGGAGAAGKRPKRRVS